MVTAITKHNGKGEVAFIGWVARDKSRDLFIFTHKPTRNHVRNVWEGVLADITPDNKMFPDITWDSEPLQVELSIRGFEG